MLWDVIIVGGGPGGMQAAIAAASEGLQTLVLEKDKVGGQIGQTPRLENSVFANGGLSGPAFAKMMREQAEVMGVTIQNVTVGKLRRRAGIISLWASHGSYSEEYVARTVVLAMGNRWADLNIPGMKESISAGLVKVGPVDCLNTQVTGREVAVFGGGPSAGQAIIELAERGAEKVHVILRSSKLRMPQYLVDRIEGMENVQLHEETRIEKLLVINRELLIRFPDETISVDAMFACNGLVPATDWLKGSGIQLDSNGRVITSAPSLETAIPNVYAIGDCRAGSTPRVGVAIGDGSMVVTEIWNHFLKSQTCTHCKKILA